MPQSSHWSLDKRVPIAVIITCLMQLAGLIWMISKLDNRVANVEAWQVEHGGFLQSAGKFEARVANVEAWQAEHSRDREMLVRIDEKLNGMIERLDRGEAIAGRKKP